jgi:hypothetical protein
MRWAGQVAHMRDAYNTLQSEGKDSLGYLGSN